MKDTVSGDGFLKSLEGPGAVRGPVSIWDACHVCVLARVAGQKGQSVAGQKGQGMWGRGGEGVWGAIDWGRLYRWEQEYRKMIWECVLRFIFGNMFFSPFCFPSFSWFVCVSSI